MTTLGLRRGRGWDALSVLLVGAFAVWAAAVLAMWFGGLHASGAVRLALTLGVPPLVVAAALLGRWDLPVLPALAGAACAIPAAVLIPPIAGARPALGLAIPALALGGLVTHRFPAASLGLVFAITGTYGTLTAFTGVAVVSIGEAVLGGLWAGIVGRLLIGRRAMALRPTPAFVLLAAFMLMTLAAFVFTQPTGAGIRALRLAPLYLSPLLLVGYGGFRDETLGKLARVMVAVSFVVAAYAALRWAIGTSDKERALQTTDFARQYNQLAETGDTKLQGSLPNGNLLGLWTACTTPFLVAAAVSWRGGLRALAIAALPLSAIALLGSSQRVAAAAVVAGSLTVIVLHVISRGFRGPRLGVAIAAVVALAVTAALVVPAVLDNPEKRKRYENILTPQQDVPFQERVIKWQQTLDALDGKPFGFGLGAGNGIAIPHRFADIASQEIDNSYLLIAYDQGLLVMAFFIVTLLVLLLELIRHAVWTRGPTGAALAGAAAGTLVAMAIEFLGANYVSTRPIVAGWMIVGLGVAQLRASRAAPQASLAP
jgi:hypothetical protein